MSTQRHGHAYKHRVRASADDAYQTCYACDAYCTTLRTALCARGCLHRAARTWSSCRSTGLCGCLCETSVSCSVTTQPMSLCASAPHSSAQPLQQTSKRQGNLQHAPPKQRRGDDETCFTTLPKISAYNVCNVFATVGRMYNRLTAPNGCNAVQL